MLPTRKTGKELDDPHLTELLLELMRGSPVFRDSGCATKSSLSAPTGTTGSPIHEAESVEIRVSSRR